MRRWRARSESISTTRTLASIACTRPRRPLPTTSRATDRRSRSSARARSTWIAASVGARSRRARSTGGSASCPTSSARAAAARRPLASRRS
eukprot:1437814-Prymnesium_polylepis.1